MFIKINSLGGDPHDFITVKSLASVIDKNDLEKGINTVHYKLSRINNNNNTDLDYCHPFPDSDKSEDEKTGPKFIVFNDKCEAFIKESKNG